MKLTLAAFLTALLLDQASKWAILNSLVEHPFTLVDVAAPWMSFGLLKNTGINFGAFSSYPGFIYAATIAFAITAAIGLLAWSRKVEKPALKIIFGCVAGGAIGNAIDRIIHGGVVDFINVSTPHFQNPFLFNVADIFVVGGAVLMVPLLHSADQLHDTSMKS